MTMTSECHLVRNLLCFRLELADQTWTLGIQNVREYVARNQTSCPNSKASFSGCLFSNLPLCGQIFRIQGFKDHR